jgi:hypothetical protein
MRLASLCLILTCTLLLIACSNQPGGNDKARIYSYVDAQGNLVQGEMAPPSAPSRALRSDTASQVMQMQSQSAQDKKQPAQGATTGYQTPEQAEAKVEAKAHDRFVTYYNAEGTLVRERIDPVAAKAHEDEVIAQKNYEEIAELAAQTSRDRQYLETTTAIPADCCTDILEYADKLKSGKNKSLHFHAGEYGWIHLSQPHPAHIYRLGDKVKRLVIKSFKQEGHYLHPYLLFLDAKGVPLLAVNNLFQRRYGETWYRYGYVQGSVTVPDKVAYAVFYLPYETGSKEKGMEPCTAPSLVPETDATPYGNGELLIAAESS